MGPLALSNSRIGHTAAHLLALHMRGVSGNTQSTEPDEGRDNCVISAGATRLRLFRHAVDHIASRLSVNQSDNWCECCLEKDGNTDWSHSLPAVAGHS